MTIHTCPPVHQTMGDRHAAIVRIVGAVASPSRWAILFASSCNSGSATSDSAANRRPKRHTLAIDQTKTAALPSNQRVARHDLARFHRGVMLDNRMDFGAVSAAADCWPALNAPA